MRISKMLPLMCVAAVCVSFVARADDNAAQAAARAALMEKMQEMNSGQSNSPAPPPAVPAPEEAPPVTTPAPVPAPENQMPPVATPPAPAMTAPQPETETTAPVATQSDFSAPPQTTTDDNAAQSAAREALLAQEMEMANGQPTNPPAPVMVPPMAMTNSVSPSVPPPAVEMQNAQPTNASPAMNEISEPQPATLPEPAEKPGFFSRVFHPFHHQAAVVEEKPMPPEKNSGFAPIVPPPAPVSQEKQAELQNLLQKYEADQITAEEYQAGRAKIVNSP